MTGEIAGMAAKLVETGEKIDEVAKKTEKVVSTIEKPIKIVEKVTADKDGKWSSDIVKNKVVSEIEGRLSDHLKDYLGKTDDLKDNALLEQETHSEHIEDSNQNYDNAHNKNVSIEDKLNRYLDLSDSQKLEPSDEHIECDINVSEIEFKENENTYSSDDGQDGTNRAEYDEGETSDVTNEESDINGVENADVREKTDATVEKIEKTIGTSEGIEELIDKHPEKEELWKSQIESIETLNDPDASPAEIRSAQAKLGILKGQILETAVKDALTEVGFDVEEQQRLVEGENGGTRPDVIAQNNTDKPIEVFGVTIQSGDTISIECKCGGSRYIDAQLKTHIPNQLSGQEGTKMLLTTSDINDTSEGLAQSVCDKYDAKLVALDVSVSDVENAIKEVKNE